ncbi:MAG: autotransporter domain-containing protein [Deltaproteobacteria bacterium]|nr:autotransporter domain-containing protein [Deltaproteobacteria bacterium]
MAWQRQNLVRPLLIAVLSIFIFIAPKSIFAANPIPVHDLAIGVNCVSFHYTEPNGEAVGVAGDLMKEDGTLYGGEITYTFHKNSLMQHISIEYCEGKVDYDGHYTDGTPVEIADFKDQMANARYLAGHDFIISGEHRITPFLGIACRYLNDDGHKKSTAAYEREISSVYSPIGLEATSSISEDWSLGIRAEYDLFWGGEVKTHLSDIAPFTYEGGTYIYKDVKNRQDAFDGRGTRVSLFFRCLTKGKSFAYTIEPYLWDWRINHSNKKAVVLIPVDGVSEPLSPGLGYEPKNRTRIYGVKFTLHFVRF